MFKGLVETLRGQPVAVGLAAGTVLLVMVIVLVLRSGDSSSVAASKGGAKLYFTDDDGKTWFLEDAKKIPPFVGSRGKDTYRAVLYRCGHGKVFVGHLEGYDEATKRTMTQAVAKDPRAAENMPFLGGMKVKRPGGKRWVTMKIGSPSPEYMEIMTPVCPDGANTNIEVVSPDEDVKPPGQ
jgi:hypothetical protein